MKSISANIILIHLILPVVKFKYLSCICPWALLSTYDHISLVYGRAYSKG